MSSYDTAIDESEYDLEGGSEDDANDGAAFTEYQQDEPSGRRDTTFAPDVRHTATASATNMSTQQAAAAAAAPRNEHQDQQLFPPSPPRNDDDACPLDNTQETAYTVATTATATSNGSLYSASTNDFPTVPPTNNAQEFTVFLQEYNGKSPLDDPTLASNKTLHDTMNDICLHASTGAERPSRLRTVPTRLTDQSWLEAANKKPPGKGKTADIAVAEVAPMHNLFGDALGDGGGDDGGGGITTTNTNDTDDTVYPDPVESYTVPQKAPKARFAVAAAATNTSATSSSTNKRASNIPTRVRDAVGCGICDQCVKDVCGRCRGCHEPASTTLNRWCVLKCCTIHVPTIGEWYERAIDRMLKVKEDLHKNQAIYGYWEDSQVRFDRCVV
jgi:hypothetical protein